MHAVLISNPEATDVTEASRRVAERALEATFDLELVSTTSRGHAAHLAAEAVEAGAKTVIAYGGDGTVHEVANGLLSAAPEVEATLAVLPGGGTNVVARNLGYPNTLVEATAHLIDLVDRGQPSRLDIGQLRISGEAGAEARYFLFGCGAALDGDTVRRVQASGNRARFGDAGFVWYTLRSYIALRRSGEPPLIVETAHGDVDAWWAIIGASDPFTYLGRHAIRATPGTRDHSGIDLLAARHIGLLRTLRWVGQALGKGKHIRDEKAIHLTDQQEIRVRTRRPVHVQADGEYLGEATEIAAVPVPRALPVWA